MSLIHKFVNLSWRDQQLLLEALGFLLTARLVFWLLPFRWLAPHLGIQGALSSTQENLEILSRARRISWALKTIGRRAIPLQQCLIQAAAGKWMLQKHGIASTLFLGLQRNDEKKIEAHAWLRCGNIVVTGDGDLEELTVISSFS